MIDGSSRTGVRRGGTIAAALAAFGLASTLAACASTASGSPVGSGSATARSVPMIPAPTSTAPPSGSPSVNPGGRMSPAPTTSAGAQVTEPPAGAKYVPIMQESQSSDGRTLSLEIEARGGACGQYMVVVQQSPSAVHVGLVQLPVRKGVMCPMFIGPRTFHAQLSSPLDGRPLIDLANGAQIGP